MVATHCRVSRKVSGWDRTFLIFREKNMKIIANHTNTVENDVKFVENIKKLRKIYYMYSRRTPSSSLFSTEMDSACSQLHVGSGFFKLQLRAGMYYVVGGRRVGGWGGAFGRRSAGGPGGCPCGSRSVPQTTRT